MVLFIVSLPMDSQLDLSMLWRCCINRAKVQLLDAIFHKRTLNLVSALANTICIVFECSTTRDCMTHQALSVQEKSRALDVMVAWPSHGQES